MKVSDFADVDLPSLPDLPGMTSDSECRYLYWLCNSRLAGNGDVVEVGSWLGRSSIHIAAGLAASDRTTPLHCFDGFAWAPNDSGKFALPLRPGDDFQKYFLENLSAFSDRVTAHKTKIAAIQWGGSPIELLFLDAPKKLPEITRCLQVFGPSLQPGEATIAIQDYLYFPAYALAACFYKLGNRLSLREVVLDGSTVAFSVDLAIDLMNERPAGWNFRDWSVTEVQDAWNEILEPLPPAARERLEPGRALHLYDCGEKQEAVRAMKALPMTAFQHQKIAGLSRSHHYLSYPELFTAAGFPGTPKQNMMARAKRIRDWARSLGSAG